MGKPSFDELAAIIREVAQVPPEQPIREDTQFERDLGVTGDDGGYLLQAVEKRLNIPFPANADDFRRLFDLADREYLFNSEGWDIETILPFGKKSTVRAFTVGELHKALLLIVSGPGDGEGLRPD
jgi:hypothetical protein